MHILHRYHTFMHSNLVESGVLFSPGLHKINITVLCTVELVLRPQKGFDNPSRLREVVSLQGSKTLKKEVVRE